MKLIFIFCSLFQLIWTFSTFTFSRNQNPCPNNMALQTDDKNSSATICKCLDTFLKYPDDGSCYNAYRRGPCPSEHYLVLPPGEKIAKCEKNPCLLDGLVPFQGDCYFLWISKTPCEEQSHHLTVNRSSFEIECSDEPYVGDMLRLKISKSCSENSMLVSMNENQTKWSCECNPGFLRDVKNNSCQEAYRQGTCPSEYYFIIPPGEKEARCEKNVCLEDRLVPFQDGCYPLYKFGLPCRSYHYLGVDKNTLELKCIFSVEHHIHYHRDGIINAPIKLCPPGTRRAFNGCKRTFQ